MGRLARMGDQVYSEEFGRGEVVWVYRFGLLVEFVGGAERHLLDSDVQVVEPMQ